MCNIESSVKVSVYFVTNVFSFFLNILLTKLQHKNENRRINVDTFDFQEIEWDSFVIFWHFLFFNFTKYHWNLFVIRHYIWQSSEICSSYNPTFPMKIVHNKGSITTTIKTWKKNNITSISTIFQKLYRRYFLLVALYTTEKNTFLYKYINNYLHCFNDTYLNLKLVNCKSFLLVYSIISKCNSFNAFNHRNQKKFLPGNLLPKPVGFKYL